MNIDEIRARIEDAIGEKSDHWLDLACDMCIKHRAFHYKLKIYDIDTIGGRIYAARSAAGMSQRQLAARIGGDFGNICRWERGSRAVPVSFIPKIGITLRVSPRWLTMLTDEGAPVVRRGVLRRHRPPVVVEYERRAKKWHESQRKLDEIEERKRAHERQKEAELELEELGKRRAR